MCEQDARFRARDTPIAKKPCQPTLQLLAPVSEALPLEAPSTTPEAPNPDAKVKGVYERQTNDGTVYDVIAYCQGVYCWGGRYRTHKAAVEARTKLSLTSSQVAAVAGVANVTGERGISVRFNKGRGPGEERDHSRLHCAHLPKRVPKIWAVLARLRRRAPPLRVHAPKPLLRRETHAHKPMCGVCVCVCHVTWRRATTASAERRFTVACARLAIALVCAPADGFLDTCLRFSVACCVRLSWRRLGRFDSFGSFGRFARFPIRAVPNTPLLGKRFLGMGLATAAGEHLGPGAGAHCLLHLFEREGAEIAANHRPGRVERQHLRDDVSDCVGGRAPAVAFTGRLRERVPNFDESKHAASRVRGDVSRVVSKFLTKGPFAIAARVGAHGERDCIPTGCKPEGAVLDNLAVRWCMQHGVDPARVVQTKPVRDGLGCCRPDHSGAAHPPVDGGSNRINATAKYSRPLRGAAWQ